MRHPCYLVEVSNKSLHLFTVHLNHSDWVLINTLLLDLGCWVIAGRHLVELSNYSFSNAWTFLVYKSRGAISGAFAVSRVGWRLGFLQFWFVVWRKQLKFECFDGSRPQKANFWALESRLSAAFSTSIEVNVDSWPWFWQLNGCSGFVL